MFRILKKALVVSIFVCSVQSAQAGFMNSVKELFTEAPVDRVQKSADTNRESSVKIADVEDRLKRMNLTCSGKVSGKVYVLDDNKANLDVNLPKEEGVAHQKIL